MWGSGDACLSDTAVLTTIVVWMLMIQSKPVLRLPACFDGGIALMRQNIRRRNPSHTEHQVDTELDAWLYRTNDPISGDISGRVRVRDKD